MSTPTNHSFPESKIPDPTLKPTERVSPRPKGFLDRRLSLGIKLPLMVIFSLLLAFLVSTFLSVRTARTALIDTLKNELTAQTKSKAELIRSNLIWTRSVAIDLAASAEVTNYDEETILNVIHNTLKRNEQIYGSTIAYEPYQFQPALFYWSPYYSRASNNELRFTQLGTPEYNYFKWDWYTLPKTKGIPILSPPYYDAGGGEIWMVTWSAPFFDATGKLKGVATADIAFSQTQEIVSKISVGQNGYAFLLDPQGIILGIGDKGGSYQAMVDSMIAPTQSESWAGLISAMLKGDTGFAEAVDAQGQDMFVAYTPVGLDTGWSLGLAFPQAELFQQASQLQNTLTIYASLIALVFGIILYLFTRSITRPLQRLTVHASHFSTEHLAKGQLAEQIQIRSQDELEDLAEAFNQMATSLAQSFGTLEEKVAERTRDVERRSLELATISELARDIVTYHDLDTLLSTTVDLIRERFDFYHAGIFLNDDRNEYAVLRAASGIAGKKMLESRHKLKVGETGIVGYVTSTGQPRIALDVGMDAVHFQNPLLPDTRSEIALPLRSHNITIGALDIQSREPNAFNEDAIKIFLLLADQLVAAIENAQLVHQVDTTLKELDIAYRTQTQQAWQHAIQSRGSVAYEYDGMQIRSVPHEISSKDLKQLQSGKAIVTTTGRPENELDHGQAGNTLLVPLIILNQVIGVIGLEQDNADYKWTEDNIAIAEAAARRAALSLENARLLEEAQRRASKERIIGEISTKIGSVVNIDSIIETAVRELGRTMAGAEVAIQLQSRDSEGKQP